MKCLIVDDSATMRRILVNSLRTLGFDSLTEAGDGREALERVSADTSLVVTDWNMPNMGGLDFVRALRANPETAKLPVLMVTTRGAKEDILQAVEAGVNSYILKPFTPPVLKDKIDQVFAAAQAS